MIMENGQRSGLVAGLRLAVTTFTVVPLPVGRVDRSAAAVAMSAAPAVGAALGAAAGATVAGLVAAGAPPLVAGGVAVALTAVLTRGLHLDGLADTVDGLGSYRSGSAALDIMKRPDVGPFGVVALIVVLLLQTASFAALDGAAAVLAGLVALATGRLAVTWACRRGVPAARPEGLGALVAGTVRWPWLAAATVAVLAVSVVAVPDRWWQGPAAVAAAIAVAAVVERHAIRRLGGITGDVLGALTELSTTVTLLTLVLHR